MEVKQDCIFFKGDIPCKPHKNNGYHCDNCPEYKSFQERILIIKLGASGDVLRTTPILHPLREKYPNAHITWITRTTEFVPTHYVNHVLEWNMDSVLWLLGREFDIVYNLDKDKEAIGLANRLQTKVLKGYKINEFGYCIPADDDSLHKWNTGIWDDLCLANRKSYPQEIVELCGFEYKKQEYILERPSTFIPFGLTPNFKTIGLNTGCGNRWLTRLWGSDNWVSLSKKLNKAGYVPVLLGGPHEHEMNMRISTRGKALYFGTKPLSEFINIINNCDLVVTSVTMAMHITIALKKKLILFNNIFNKHEFELYGLGTILEPDKPCKCCYKNTCDEKCMETIPVDTVFNEIVKLIGEA